ncbi:MAG TPA: hypothetical protein VGS00_00160 [Thermoanaerobaculia bacterium]|nr:hypothetical protein [Thermoanaerobaculia bacterium]
MHHPARPAAPVLALVLALAFATAGVAGLAADRTLTASGTIVKIDAKTRTVVVAVTDGPETIFGWSADTKISGTLSPGARVTVRYTAGDDGKNLALQISVSRG